MSSAKHRWMKFWPTDWRSDTALRQCGYAARGFWMDLITLMHEAQPYGHLLLAGKAPSPRQLAMLLGGSAAEVEAMLAELEEAGVFSRTPEGVIYSRRMVRDAQASEAGRQAVGLRWNGRGTRGAEGDAPTPPNRGANRGAITPPNSLDTEAEAEAELPPSGVSEPAPSGAPSDPPPPQPGEGDPPQPPGKPPRKPPPVPEAVMLDMVAVWNDLAAEHGLPQVRDLTDGRRDKLRTRIASRGWTQDPVRQFRAYVRTFLRDPFNRGENNRGWKADFDYAIRSDEIVLRAIEKAAAMSDEGRG